MLAYPYSISNIQPPTLAKTPRNRARSPRMMTPGKPRGLVGYGYLQEHTPPVIPHTTGWAGSMGHVTSACPTQRQL